MLHSSKLCGGPATWLNSLLISPTVYYGVSSALFPRPHPSNLLISLPTSILFFQDGRPASVVPGGHQHSLPGLQRIVSLQFLATILPLCLKLPSATAHHVPYCLSTSLDSGLDVTHFISFIHPWSWTNYIGCLSFPILAAAHLLSSAIRN